jgi:hypothetical protein
MSRTLSLPLLVLAMFPLVVRADAFDNYTNPLLGKVPGAEGVKEVQRLTPDLLADHDRVLPGVAGAFIVVKTNEGRLAKLLVLSAQQKLEGGRRVPILLIDRFVTFKEGTDQTVVAAGKNLYLFPGFRFSLDLGQVVPEGLTADLRFMAEGDTIAAEPVGKARAYLLSRGLPEAAPKKTPKLVVGETFEPRYFNGTFRLYDDGRRSGKLKLDVADNGEVTGAYYSDKDGEKYEVTGMVRTPKHAITFTVKFPRSEQVFQGWLFTGDARVITGSSRLQEREAGFYAVRVEEE